MSILGWLLKPKKDMAHPNTKRVKMGKYTISSHAQNRVAQDSRNVTKWDVVDNLFTKPNGKTTISGNGEYKSYARVGKKITTCINPDTNVVSTVRPISRQDKRDFNLVKRGNKYVKKNKR